MKIIFNPILIKGAEKRLRKFYRLKRIKKESKKSYFKWRKEINNNNNLFESLYFVACQEEASLIELYDRHIGNDVVIAECLDGEIIGGDSFNKIYDTLEGDYYHYRDKESLILVNTCNKLQRWHFYKKPKGKAEKLDIFACIPASEPVAKEVAECDKTEDIQNIESNNNNISESEEKNDDTEENSDC